MSQQWTPYNIYDEVLLWLDAADPNNNGGVGLPADGRSLYRWVDKSKNGYVFEQSASADMPVYDAVNKKVVFDGTEHLTCEGIDNWTADFHVYIIGAITFSNNSIVNVMLSADSGDGLSDWSFVGEESSTEVASLLNFKQFSGGTSASITSVEKAVAGASALYECLCAIYVTYVALNNEAVAADGVGMRIDNDCTLHLMRNTDLTLTLTGSVTVVAGETITQAVSGATGVVYNDGTLTDGILTLYEITGTFDLVNELTGSTSGALLANSVPTATALNETIGEIQEVIVLDALSSRGKRWAVQGYLQDKYGLDVLLAGVDETAPVAVHPYKNNPPLTNDVLTVNASTGGTYTLDNIFQGAHQISPRNPLQYVRVSLDYCDNLFASGVFPSTCTADSVAEPCFNTRATCVDKDNYRIDSNGKRQYYFTQEVGETLAGKVAKSHPALISVSSAPTEIVPTKGISLRSNVTIKLRDFMSVDSDQDDYYAQRSIIATDEGTFFERLIARTPHYLGRPIEVFDGFVDVEGNAQSENGRRKYIIESMFLDKGVCTIKCKDPLTLADELKTKVPAPSGFALLADLGTGTDNDVQLTYGGSTVTEYTTINFAGTAYSNNDELTFTGGNGTGFEITVSANVSGAVTRYEITNTGTGYLVGDLLTDAAGDLVLEVADLAGKLFFDTFGNNDATGFIRINDEILKYEVDGNNSSGSTVNPHLHCTAANRPVWGTETDAHEADDTVQWCLVFGDEPEKVSPTDLGSTINDVAYEILVNQAGVPAKAINETAGGEYSWADEKTNWLSTYLIRTIFSEPREANKVVSELGSAVGCNFFYDDLSGLIVMKAETPELDSSKIVTVTDDHISLDSFKLINSEKERVSRVYYYYNQRNLTDDRDKPKSYRKLYVNIDSDSELDNEYGVANIKTVYAYGVQDKSTATSVSQRLLNRFKDTPKTCTFNLDVSFDTLKTGDHFYLLTRHITNYYGAPALTEMQVLSTKLDSKKQEYNIKAKSFRFGTTSGSVITAAGAAITVAGTGYAVGESITFTTGGGGSGFTVDIWKVDGGAVTGVTVTSFGTGNAAGDVLTYAGGSSTGASLQLTIGRVPFVDEGGGVGSDADPYTGARASQSYICTDDDKLLTGRPYITASVISGGTGWTGETGAALTGTEITASQGAGLALTVTVVGDAVTAAVVDSNPATGSTLSDGGAIGYFDGQIVTCANGAGSGIDAQIKLTLRAKMSDGSAPYTIV